MLRRRRQDGQVFRITGTAAGLTQDVRARQRRYVVSMSIRTVCFLLAVVLWHVEIIAAVIALVLGGVLPYIAVVIANAGRENSIEFPPADIPPDERPALGQAAEWSREDAVRPAQSPRGE